MADRDVLSQLLEASFRGISFPTQMIHAQGSHNVVPHKRVDRNGWRVENTGQNSYVFTFKIPFINTLVRGKNETWPQQLYPDVYTKFLTALEDRSTGDFVHPAYGLRKCKVESWTDEIDPDFRGGPTLTVNLMETVDDGDSVAIANTAVVPIEAAAAASLDGNYNFLHPSPFINDIGDISLSDFVKSIGAAIDTLELEGQQILGKINRVIHTLTVLKGKFSGNGPFMDDVDRLISSLHSHQTILLKQDKSTSYYIVPKATTLASVALRKGNSLGDLLKLNPKLAKSVVVPPETAVRFYS